MTVLKIKKSYQELFPLPTKEVYNSIKEDIEKNGQQSPIIHNKIGFILDGYTRHKILKELKKKPLVILREFSTLEEELDFIISMNMQRRDLTHSQRFFIYEEYRQLILKLNYQHNHSKISNKPSPHGNVRLVISKKAGISPTTYNRIVFILNHGTQVDIDKLKTEQVSIHNLYNILQLRLKVKENKKEEEEVLDSVIKTEKKQHIICPECGGKGKIWI